jgi:hypothetical protein
MASPVQDPVSVLRTKVLVRGVAETQAQNVQVTAHARSMRSVPHSDGRERKNIVVPAAGSVVVTHGLGRMPRGVDILDGDNNQITNGNRTKTTITFTNAAATAATLTLWIY